MRTRGSTGASAVRTADEPTFNKDVFESKLSITAVLMLCTLLIPGDSSPGKDWCGGGGGGSEAPKRKCLVSQSGAHMDISLVFTWAGSHCRAPMDSSMFFSSPLSCRSATSLPPPTHLSPMNTRGTYMHGDRGVGKGRTIFQEPAHT